MHKIVYLFIFSTFISMSLIASDTKENNDSGQSAILFIDGKEHEVEIDKNKEIEIAGQKYIVKIKLNPFKIFNHAGIEFKYSHRMSFNLDDSDPNVLIWSIDSDPSSIMVQQFKYDIGEDDFLQALKFQYKLMKANVEIKEIELKTKNNTLKGKSLTIRMGNVPIRQNVFVIASKTGKIAVILQDTLTDEGKYTEGYNQMVKTFSKTFKIQ